MSSRYPSCAFVKFGGKSLQRQFFQENTVSLNADRNFSCYAKNTLGTQWNQVIYIAYIILVLLSVIKNSLKTSTSTKRSFICSSSADLLEFQNNVYLWQKSLGIVVGDFQKSPPPNPFSSEERVDTQLEVIRRNGGLNPVERMQLSWVIPTINLRHFPKRNLRDQHSFQSWLTYLPKYRQF